MTDGSPTLEVGFAIDTGDSFNALNQLAAVMDSTEAKIVREAQSIQDATSGMLNLGSQTAAISAFSSNTSAAFNKAETAADRLTARLQEQTATFGMTRAAALAWRAEQAGATDAADRLREAEAALVTKQGELATSTRAASLATQGFASSASTMAAGASAATGFSTGIASVGRSAQATQIEMLEMTHIARSLTEQISTGVNPLRALAMESGRFMTAVQYGGAGIGGFVKQFASMLGIIKIVQDAELSEVASSTAAQAAAIAAAAGRAKAAGTAADAEIELSLAAQRVAATEAETAVAATRLAAGYEAQAVAATQLAVAEDALAVAQGRAAEAAAEAKAATVTSIGATTMILAPLAAMAAVAFGAFKQFQSQVKDSGDLTDFRDNLGLTRKEMLQLSDGVDSVGDKFKTLGDVSVTAGDVMAGIWKTVKDQAQLSGDWDNFKKDATAAFNGVLEAWSITSAGITAGIYGTFNIVKVVWGTFPAVFGDLFVQAVNAAIAALNGLVKAGVDELNSYIALVNLIPGVKIGAVSAPMIGNIDNANAGAAAKAAGEIGKSYSDAYAEARKADTAFWHQVGVNSQQHAKDRMTEEANAIKANRTPKKPKKEPIDHNALNAEAIEAQIKNLYKLADAYGVSGAAALVAEAREKAESKAIKSRADVEDAVDRQIRLAIAQRIADAAKSTAAMNEQASVQEAVNAQVAAGLVPASKAAQVMQDQLALYPVISAQQAALQQADEAGAKAKADRAAGDTAAAIADAAHQASFIADAKRAGQAIDDMTAAQRRLNAAKSEAQYQSAMADIDDEADRLKLEAQLIDATTASRVHALAALKALQEAEKLNLGPMEMMNYVSGKVANADQGQKTTEATAQLNEQLRVTAQLADTVGDAFGKAFGTVGQSIGDAIKALGDLGEKQDAIARQVKAGTLTQAGATKEMTSLQINAYGDMLDAAKGFFKEGSAGWQVIAAAEKVYRVAQLAFSVAAILQNTTETATHVANAGVQATADGTAGIAKQSQLPFPANIFAMAATAAALVAAGVAIFGGTGTGSTSHVDPGNTGTGTVLGDSSAKSDSIKNALDDLKNVNTLMLTTSRAMEASLKSIDAQIGSFAAEIVKSAGGNINDSANITTGFKTSGLGSILSNIPLIGGFLSSLFGTRTDILGGGLYGGAQSVGQIEASGYQGQSYTDLEKTSKFLGIVTGHSYSTQYGSLDPSLNSQFTLILKSFDQAIAAAAPALGDATDAVQAKLNGFVVNIGKIDLNGLSGADIQSKLENVFGALGDQMAAYVYPEITAYQKVGEGALETLTRVASTVESVTAGLNELGISTKNIGIAAQMGIAGQFDSISDMTSATDAYFAAFYTSAEQAAAKTAQFTKVFDSLGLAMPSTLAGFRQLVEAQDLTTAAGQQTYATLLQLAPAFADLQSSMTGAKSAADILSEQQDLQNQLWQLLGDTADIRAAQLASLDPSNRALQEQVYAVTDAQAAAKAASDLADAWKTVGDSIMDEINRIRGLSDPTGNGSFASLMAQFNAATTAARGGDQTAAQNLPQLSQALLTAAAAAATSRQELDRVQAQTAASLQTTYDAINVLAASPATTSSTSNAALLAAAANTSQATSTPAAANDDIVSAIENLRADVTQLRGDMNTGNATIAAGTSKTARILDQASQPYGGQAIAVGNA